MVLDQIQRADGISRVEIAQRTGLTPQSVSGIVRRLLDEGIVREDHANRVSSGGSHAPPCGSTPMRAAPSNSILTRSSSPVPWSICSAGRGCFVVDTAAELGTTDPEVRKKTEDAFDATRKTLASLPGRGIRDGDLPAALDVGAAVELLFTAVLGLRVRFEAGEGPGPNLGPFGFGRWPAQTVDRSNRGNSSSVSPSDDPPQLPLPACSNRLIV
ncbi:winged helix-turn-helix domain-containing protein [Streptosporangium sp. NBC_01756]|uniref:winged helix-turn-helix domain-containing protein n=1 Tax=Streptosporangium sp. NBC_01756 TaxID=2975950 RepID=UPI002DD7B4C2|nr:winged helix-turn-helix domain-containing protein [Streptosporangium sp. NBC_01756]WSC86752.1 winged helix-turn-helix domain-containing protein [Streptosporangium sp. NBC_01756]